MFNLEEAKILVAGGSSGVGLATAKLLDQAGAFVTIGAREEKKLEHARQLLCLCNFSTLSEPRHRCVCLSAINSAIEDMVKPLAVELKPRRVNAAPPGVVDTPWWNRLSPEEKRETFNRFAQAAPVGRIGKPEDIALAIVFFVCNTFMTGGIIECDGGLRLVGQQL